MRITQSMLADTMLRNITKNVSKLNDLEQQITSGQRISRPSQDPVGAAVILQLDSAKAQADQHIKNVDDATSWLDLSDQALSSIGDNLARGRQLAIAAPNGTLSTDDRNAIVSELNGLIQQVASTGNYNYAGQYIFSGQATHTPPFDTTTSPPTYQGDSNGIQHIVDVGVNVQVNVTGDSAIKPTLDALTQLRDAVQANDTAGMRSGLDALDSAQTALLAARAEIGARVNRLDAQKQRLQDAQLSYQSLRSDTQDVDMAKALTDYSMQQVVYKASLQAGGSTIQTSLIDYLR